MDRAILLLQFSVFMAFYRVIFMFLSHLFYLIRAIQVKLHQTESKNHFGLQTTLRNQKYIQADVTRYSVLRMPAACAVNFSS
jgi:hypothetical protein